MSLPETVRLTVAVILAGGLARRMGGGDKCRLVVGEQTIIDRTIARISPQVTCLAVSANGETARFADLELPILPDPLPGYPGPLAGILAGLEWANGLGAGWLVSVPGDCPFLPTDLVERLHMAREAERSTFACAGSGGWTHPVIGLWPLSQTAELRAGLLAGERKIDAFTGRHKVATAVWETDLLDPFLNVNSPADLAEAERLCASGAG